MHRLRPALTPTINQSILRSQVSGRSRWALKLILSVCLSCVISDQLLELAAPLLPVAFVCLYLFWDLSSACEAER